MSTHHFFTAGGTLRASAPSYVERQADSELRSYAASGQLCYVLTTRQMGKSSLMTRVARQLRADGVQTAIVDLTSIGTAAIDEWYLGILDDLQGQLDLETDAETWWEVNRSRSPVKQFTRFIDEVVLREVDGRVAIFIDEIDSALNLTFSDDFFAAIRALYNRQSAEIEPRIAFVLLGVAAPNDLIKDIGRTPFNVGERISLHELDFDQTLPIFAQGLPTPAAPILRRIFHWTNGHPYLTQKTAQAIVRREHTDWDDAAVDQLVHELFLTERAFSAESNLQFINGRLTDSQRSESLLRLYQQLLRGKQIANDNRSPDQATLKLIGLLKPDENGMLTVRNRLYAAAFDRRWLHEQLPQHNRPLIAVATVALFTIALLLLTVWRQSRQTEAVLVESYITTFNSSDNAAVRLDNLANLYQVEGYVEQASDLFGQLPEAEKIALLEAGSAELQSQAEIIIQNVYTGLAADDFRQHTPLLAAMQRGLVNANQLQNPTLPVELDNWLAARQAALDGAFDSAELAYTVALSLNPSNAALRYERLLSSLATGNDASALADIAWLLADDPQWETRLASLAATSAPLQQALYNADAPPAQLAAFIPTATATSVAIDPTQTPAPTATPLPTLTPTATPTDIPTTDEPPTDVPPTTEPPLIAFVGTQNERSNLYTMRADGSDLQSLTDRAAALEFPDWSPDGSQIAFASESNDSLDLFIMNANGGGLIQLTDNPGVDTAPAWSPDGTQIAFHSYVNSEQADIYIISADGGEQTRITSHTAFDWQPVWSPDGTQLAFMSNRDGDWDIYTIDLDTWVVVNITNDDGDNFNPSWSPDGTRIAYGMVFQSSWDIFVQSLDTGLRVNLTNSRQNEWTPFWISAEELLIAQETAGVFDLYVISADGRTSRRITDSPLNENYPVQQPSR